MIAQAARRSEAAARLLGGEDRLKHATGFAGFAETPKWRKQTARLVRERLGDERFALAWEDGRSRSTEAAISEALVLADALAAGSC